MPLTSASRRESPSRAQRFTTRTTAWPSTRALTSPSRAATAAAATASASAPSAAATTTRSATSRSSTPRSSTRTTASASRPSPTPRARSRESPTRASPSPTLQSTASSSSRTTRTALPLVCLPPWLLPLTQPQPQPLPPLRPPADGKLARHSHRRRPDHGPHGQERQGQRRLGCRAGLHPLRLLQQLDLERRFHHRRREVEQVRGRPLGRFVLDGRSLFVVSFVFSASDGRACLGARGGEAAAAVGSTEENLSYYELL